VQARDLVSAVLSLLFGEWFAEDKFKIIGATACGTSRDQTGRNRSQREPSSRSDWPIAGVVSVACARFKSPLAHQYDPWRDLGLYGIRGRS
jgi:hypothetical protein